MPYACKHCLGRKGGCIHCREQAAERSTQKRRSSLTDEDRATLEIFPRPCNTFAARLRRMMIPTDGTLVNRAAIPPSQKLGNSVLPANFQLS